MQTKYFKGFAITNELVSIEELRSIAQMQAKMDELVRYRPIQYLTDGYDFSMEEAGDPEIHFSDILWGEGIDAEHSCLHMKDGRTVALPFGTRGLEILFRESFKIFFISVSSNTHCKCNIFFYLCSLIPTHKHPVSCPDGGIGRRVGLKHQCPKGCAGSTPAPGTTKRGNYLIFK